MKYIDAFYVENLFMCVAIMNVQCNQFSSLVSFSNNHLKFHFLRIQMIYVLSYD